MCFRDIIQLWFSPSNEKSLTRTIVTHRSYNHVFLKFKKCEKVKILGPFDVLSDGDMIAELVFRASSAKRSLRAQSLPAKIESGFSARLLMLRSSAAFFPLSIWRTYCMVKRDSLLSRSKGFQVIEQSRGNEFLKAFSCQHE